MIQIFNNDQLSQIINSIKRKLPLENGKKYKFQGYEYIYSNETFNRIDTPNKNRISIGNVIMTVLENPQLKLEKLDD